MAEKKFSFEKAMTRLEEIAGILERGETPIEEALALFEEGAALLKECNAVLERAEQKVSILSGKAPDGTPVCEEFDAQ